MKEICKKTCFDEEKVQKIQTSLVDKKLNNISQIFKALSEETRITIAYALTLEKELCVCDISIIVNSTVATTSHHLKILSKAGVVQNKKVGKMVYYSLNNSLVERLIKDIVL
jgi:DNA-binding transcriptional ArsR family regulator